MKRLILFFLLPLGLGMSQMRAESVWVETEQFAVRGGWCLDQQFMDEMGSPYLLAHGMGVPVADAVTTVNFPARSTAHALNTPFGAAIARHSS